MKITFIFIFGMIAAFVCKAQAKKDYVLKIKSVSDLSWALPQFYKPDNDSLKNACWEGCVFVRFNINKNRQFEHVLFSKATPPFIADALKIAFRKMNSSGILQTQSADNARKTYVLPFIIAHNEGCGFLSGWEDTSFKRDPQLEKLYNQRQLHFNQTVASLLNMMNYTDGKAQSIDCVLLAPAMIAVTMY